MSVDEYVLPCHPEKADGMIAPAAYLIIQLAMGFTNIGRGLLRFAAWLEDIDFDELDRMSP